MVGVSASFCPLIARVVTDLDTVVCPRLSGRQPLVDVSVDDRLDEPMTRIKVVWLGDYEWVAVSPVVGSEPLRDRVHHTTHCVMVVRRVVSRGR